jgi:hypothetical protein
MTATTTRVGTLAWSTRTGGRLSGAETGSCWLRWPARTSSTPSVARRWHFASTQDVARRSPNRPCGPRRQS